MFVDGLVVFPTANEHDFLLRKTEVMTQGGEGSAESVEANRGETIADTNLVEVAHKGVGVIVYNELIRGAVKVFQEFL